LILINETDEKHQNPPAGFIKTHEDEKMTGKEEASECWPEWLCY